MVVREKSSRESVGAFESRKPNQIPRRNRIRHPGQNQPIASVGMARVWDYIRREGGASDVGPDPPTHLWVRGLRFAGLPYLINMYKRVVVVATGSGICVFLSFMLQPCPADVYVIWVAKGIEENFGDEIVRKIKSYPAEKMMIHDTAVFGRPNVSEMTVEAVRRWGAEVVIVTSNPSGSRDVVNGCKAAGIPAFGRQ